MFPYNPNDLAMVQDLYYFILYLIVWRYGHVLEFGSILALSLRKPDSWSDGAYFIQ